jgi:hypothetical protein
MPFPYSHFYIPHPRIYPVTSHLSRPSRLTCPPHLSCDPLPHEYPALDTSILACTLASIPNACAYPALSLLSRIRASIL